MDDSTFGKILVTSTLAILGYFVIWIVAIPFVDLERDHWIYIIFPDQQYILLFCAIWGLFFIGTLMLFTFYHIKPYLKQK